VSQPANKLQAYLDLVDWRRRVGDLYREGAVHGIDWFRATRDELFRSHPQSPIPAADRHNFVGLDYFAPDPAYRFKCEFEEPAADLPSELDIDTGGEDGVVRYRRAGCVSFELDGEPVRLTVLSLIGYGGGLFLPFRDATAGHETYGGGRYLFDTIKNTDALVLEVEPGSRRVTIDFNYAYNPSCAYDVRWACPLAPRENWLSIPIRAGEKAYAGSERPGPRGQ
jgi:uncharacterized protein (DUF1684 family)